MLFTMGSGYHYNWLEWFSCKTFYIFLFMKNVYEIIHMQMSDWTNFNVLKGTKNTFDIDKAAKQFSFLLSGLRNYIFCRIVFCVLLPWYVLNLTWIYWNYFLFFLCNSNSPYGFCQHSLHVVSHPFLLLTYLPHPNLMVGINYMSHNLVHPV